MQDRLATRPLRVIIAEDDAAQANALRQMLKHLRPMWDVVATTSSASLTLHELHRHQPQLVLLDVGLAGGQSALTIAPELARYSSVVFVTGEPSHALAAFDAGAIDYLLKPLRWPRLELALLRCEQLLPARWRDAADAEPPLQAPAWLRYLPLSDGNRWRWASLNHVRYLRTEGPATRVYLEGGSGLVHQRLQVIARRVDPHDFRQIHRDAVVNLQFVKQIQRSESGQLLMQIQGYAQPLRMSRAHEKRFKGSFLS